MAARKKPSTPGTIWDTGTGTLATLGDVDQMRREFRKWLAPQRDRMLAPRLIRPIEGPKRRETEREALTRAARQFCFERGYRPHLESAIMADPATGKPQNPNGVMRARRIDVVETYHKRRKIDARQLDAALRLRMAWEQTMKSPPAIKKINVDTFPKPDQHVGIILDRIGRYHAIAKHVERRHWRILSHVVLDNRTLGSLPGCSDGGVQMAMAYTALAEALDYLADALEG